MSIDRGPGAWFVEKLATAYRCSLHPDSKFHGTIGQIAIGQEKCYLLIPTTFMNHSGRAIKAVTSFYKIPVDSVLVAHDELDLLPGIARLKVGGGHGGHNGLRDICQQFASNDFSRLRLGIGHPGSANKVLSYVLGKPNHTDRLRIEEAIDHSLALIPAITAGNMQQAMKELHTQA